METQIISSAHAQIGRTRYQTIVGSGKHAIVVDEPEEIEGGDTGISPFALLLGSLGSCTAITLRMYADRKMWMLDDIRVHLELYKMNGQNTIGVWISLKGDLTEEQKKRMLTIADACPVHKLLAKSIQITTSLHEE